jgi:hypothetical protein
VPVVTCPKDMVGTRERIMIVTAHHTHRFFILPPHPTWSLYAASAANAAVTLASATFAFVLTERLKSEKEEGCQRKGLPKFTASAIL